MECGSRTNNRIDQVINQFEVIQQIAIDVIKDEVNQALPFFEIVLCGQYASKLVGPQHLKRPPVGEGPKDNGLVQVLPLVLLLVWVLPALQRIVVLGVGMQPILVHQHLDSVRVGHLLELRVDLIGVDVDEEVL